MNTSCATELLVKAGTSSKLLFHMQSFGTSSCFATCGVFTSLFLLTNIEKVGRIA